MNKKTKNNIFTFALVGFYVLVGARLAAATAVPLDVSSIPQTKNSSIAIGDNSGAAVFVNDGRSGGFITLQKSAVDYSAIGFNPSQEGISQFWYAVKSGQQIPFPLWGFNSSSEGIYTLNPLAINTNDSGVIGSSSLTVAPDGFSSLSGGVPLSFYVGDKSGDNAGIMVNAVATNIGGVPNLWNWTDVNKNEPVLGVLFSSTNGSISLKTAMPYNDVSGSPLSQRWSTALQLSTDGSSALIGGPALSVAYSFTYAKSNAADCNSTSDFKTINGTDFFIDPTFGESYIFPRSTAYNLGDKLCFYLSDINIYRDYFYEPYSPPANTIVIARSVNMINPVDKSGWDTMDSTTFTKLMEGVSSNADNRGLDTDGGKLTLARTMTNSNGVNENFIQPGGGKDLGSCGGLFACRSFLGGTTYEGLNIDSWALCPKGYFATALGYHFSSNDTYIATKCGRLSSPSR